MSYIASRCIQELLGALFKQGNAIFNCEQEKENIFRMKDVLKNPSLVITVCHHSASLVMPNGDPGDVFFCTTLTLMMESYSLAYQIRISEKNPSQGSPTGITRFDPTLTLMIGSYYIITLKILTRNDWWNRTS